MVTKSIIKAMKCPKYYVGYYLTPGAVVKLIESPMARAGTEFHRYRQEYIDHLVEAGEIQDHAFIGHWLDTNAVMPETRELILGDRHYSIDPKYVVGCELFLSADENFRPLEMLQGRPPGQLSADPRCLCSGTIDLLQMKGREATITDWKSGWATAGVADHEPYIYAALVMAHFKQVDTVNYRWEFPRVNAEKDGGRYTREDLPWIQSFIRGENTREAGLRAKHAAGDQMRVDPYAGLCVFCQLQCPLRQTATNERLILPPIQNRVDAEQVAKLLYASSMIAAMARQALRPYLEQWGPKLKLAEDYELELRTTARAEYPLPDTLALLGIVIDEDALPKAQKGIKRGQAITPRWDVPIQSLLISASKLHNLSDTKMRAGMRDELGAIARRKVVSKVHVRKLNEEDRLLIEEGAEGMD